MMIIINKDEIIVSEYTQILKVSHQEISFIMDCYQIKIKGHDIKVLDLDKYEFKIQLQIKEVIYHVL